MKFQLTVKKDYCKDWDVWNGLRELISNAQDAHEEGKAMKVSHKGETLSISNEGVKLPKDVWLMGFTVKAPGARGRFGEGLPVGTLALVRAGHEVKFINDDESWTPALEDSEIFEGQQVLAVSTHKRQNGTGCFTVEVGGITKETWDLLKLRFLFITKPANVVVTGSADVLLDPDLRGKVFVKGIYVQTQSDLSAGYDFKHVSLDRDRRMVSGWDVKWYAAAAWQEAMTSFPAEHGERVVEMLQNAAPDVASMGEGLTYGGEKDRESAVKVVAEGFRKKHGDKAIPVTSMAAAREAEHYGMKGVVVQAPLMAVLKHEANLDIDKMRVVLGNSIVKTYGWSDLSEAEQAVYSQALKLVEDTAKELGYRSLEDRLSIVDFGSSDINGLYPGDGTIKLAKRLLGDFQETLRVMVHEVSHDMGGDGEKAHEAAEGRFFASMVSRLVSNVPLVH